MRTVWITGTGAVGPLGLGTPTKLGGGAGGRAPRLVPSGLDLKSGFARSAVRWLDDASLWWVNAAAQATVGTPPDRLADMGQCAGQSWGPTRPVIELERTLYEEGFSAMNPAAFPFSVGNAPAAQASLLVGLGGPSLTLNGKEACGLAAIVEACRYLEAGVMAACVAGGVDQLAPFLTKVLGPLRGRGALPSGEGAYALRLESCPVRPEGALARITAWASLASACPPHLYPEDAADVLDALLRKAGGTSRRGTSAIERVVLPEDTRALSRTVTNWHEARMPRGQRVHFQEALGVCGASWAGAAGYVARTLADGGGGPVFMAGLSTGGAACALILEDAGGQ